MRTWLDVISCLAFCALPISVAYLAPAYIKAAIPLSLAGAIFYLWLTRWRHGTY
jgi:hypothetical protein